MIVVSRQTGLTSLTRLMPASTVEDRKAFAGAFNLALDVVGVDPGAEFLLAHPNVVDQRVPKAGTCTFCGKAVDPNRDYRRVTGWEKRRAEGGTNALRCREPHEDEWACVSCIDRQASGVAPTQAAML